MGTPESRLHILVSVLLESQQNSSIQNDTKKRPEIVAEACKTTQKLSQHMVSLRATTATVPGNNVQPINRSYWRSPWQRALSVLLEESLLYLCIGLSASLNCSLMFRSSSYPLLPFKLPASYCRFHKHNLLNKHLYKGRKISSRLCHRESSWIQKHVLWVMIICLTALYPVGSTQRRNILKRHKKRLCPAHAKWLYLRSGEFTTRFYCQVNCPVWLICKTTHQNNWDCKTAPLILTLMCVQQVINSRQLTTASFCRHGSLEKYYETVGFSVKWWVWLIIAKIFLVFIFIATKAKT
jgi:hypothetical protein